MTATVTRPRFSHQSYAELVAEARLTLARTVDTMLSAGTLFAVMLKREDAQRIAADVDFTPNAVVRVAGVATFWGTVRIGPDQSGRQAPYRMYDRVAHDPLMTQGEKAEIKKQARRGRHIVEQLITEFRARHLPVTTVDRGERVVRGLRTLVRTVETVEQVSEDQLVELHTLSRELGKQLRRFDRR